MLGKRKASRIVVITPRQRAIQRKIGERLRVLREEMGLSQADLADMCHLDRNHVGAVERGEINVTMETLLVLCIHVGTTLSEIYKGIA